MNEKTEYKLMLSFTVVYLVFFSILSFFNGNHEFLYYAIVMTSLLFVVLHFHKKMQLTNHVLFGLTMMGFLHVMGGHIKIGGIRLYDLWLIGPNVLKYDNVVHAFGMFVITFISYSLLAPHLHIRNKKRIIF